MGLTFIGASTGAGTISVPTHQAGDLLLLFAFRDGSTTPPTAVFSGASTSMGSKAGTSCSCALAYKFALNASDTATLSNATRSVCLVYRAGAGEVINVGPNVGAASGTASSVSWQSGITGTQADADTNMTAKAIVAFAGHRSTNTSLETPPTSYTNRADGVDANAEAAAHDWIGFTSGNPGSVAVGGTASGWTTQHVEIWSSTIPPETNAWDPDATDGTLSNSNRTTTGGTVAYGSAKFDAKEYAEVKLDVVTDASDGAGLFGGIAYFVGTDGEVHTSLGDPGVNIGSFGQGDVICIAVDAPNVKYWFRVNNGNWNGSGTANPATGAGGLALITGDTPLPVWFNAGGAGGTSDVATINADSANFAFTPPSGFAPLYVSAGGSTTNQSVSVAAVTAVTYLKSAAKLLAIAASLSSPRQKSVQKKSPIAATSTAVFRKSITHRLAIATSTALTAARQFLKTAAVSIILVTSVVVARHSVFTKAIAAACSSTLSMARALTKRVAVAAAGTLTSSKRVSKSASIAGTTALSVKRAASKALQMAVATAGVVAKNAAKQVAIAAIPTTSATVHNAFNKAVAISVSTTVSLLHVFTKYATVAIAVSSSVALVRAVRSYIGVAAVGTVSALKGITFGVAIDATTFSRFWAGARVLISGIGTIIIQGLDEGVYYGPFWGDEDEPSNTWNDTAAPSPWVKVIPGKWD